jgi:hypothetical protein
VIKDRNLLPLTTPAFRLLRPIWDPGAVSVEGAVTHEESQDCFVVFVRDGSRSSAWWPDAAERPVAACPTYEEAARVREQLRRSGRSCVIRFVGPTGGGD